MRAPAALMIGAFGVVAFLVAGKKVSDQFPHGAVHATSTDRPTVKVRFRVIDYVEAEDRDLQIAWEPRRGMQPIAYVPSESLWRKMMPDWSQGRRGEIMGTIKTETAFMNFEWKEYDGD